MKIAVMLSVVLACSCAAQENFLLLQRGERVEGDLAPGERDILVFSEASGTRLDVKLSFDGAGPLHLELFSSAGKVDLTGYLRISTRKVALKKYVLQESGRHYLAISSDSQALYKLRLQARPVRRILLAGSDGGSGVLLSLPFSGPGTVRLDAKADRSAYQPRVVAIDGPGGEGVPFEVLRSGGGRTRVEFALAATGIYQVSLEGEGGTAGAYRAKARLKLDKLVRQSHSLVGDPAPLQAFAAGPPELEPFRRLHLLARIDRGVRAFMESSFDRLGENNDGLSGAAIYQENGEFVIFDELGPGVVNRIHFAFRSTPGLPAPLFLPGAEDYEIRFYFDDEATPRIAMPIRDFVSGTRAPFLSPATGDDLFSPGGPFVYYPIPFERRLKIATTRLGYYYQVNYHLLEPGRELASFDPARTDAAQLNALLLRAGEDPHGAVAFSCAAEKTVSIASGGVAQIFSANEPGWITSMTFQPSTGSIPLLGRTRLRIYFDADVQPSVECPLDLFFGDGLGESDLDALMFQMQTGGPYRCWWPMPYESGVRVELVNQAGAPIDYHVSITYLPLAYGGEFGSFHAREEEFVPPNISQWINLRDFPIFESSGRGHLVGLSMTVGSDGLGGQVQPRSYLEGDEHVFVDDLETPAEHGTGTEETFNWGWYEAPFALPFTLALHGFSQRFQSGLADYTACYRLLLSDRIPFESRLRFGFEQGPFGIDGAHYRGVAFAYLRAEAGAQLSDEFDVGDPVSESAHAFQGSASVLEPTLTSQFETERLRPDYATAGRSEGALNEFTLAIDPSNRGVWLRRVLDQGPGGQPFVQQRARVFVDGVYVRDWRSVRWNTVRRWLEDEILLPASFTAGKSSIRISIDPLTPVWNAYRYRALSRRP